MAWDIEWSKEAMRSMGRLERKNTERIINKLESIRSDPRKFLEKLTGYDYFKLRVGDYRVFVTLIYDKQIIFIETVDHRKRIYK